MFFSKLNYAKFTQKQGENNGNYLIPYHIKSFLIGLASIFEVFNFFFSSGSMIGNINSKVLFPSFEVTYGSSFPLKTFSFFEIWWKTYSPFYFSKFGLIGYHGWKLLHSVTTQVLPTFKDSLISWWMIFGLLNQ